MKVTVQMFAGAREAVGQREVTVALPKGATVGDLRAELLTKYPALAPLVSHSPFALNAEYATDETLLPEHADIACIPPVSGG